MTAVLKEVKHYLLAAYTGHTDHQASSKPTIHKQKYPSKGGQEHYLQIHEQVRGKKGGMRAGEGNQKHKGIHISF